MSTKRKRKATKTLSVVLSTIMALSLFVSSSALFMSMFTNEAKASTSDSMGTSGYSTNVSYNTGVSKVGDTINVGGHTWKAVAVSGTTATMQVTTALGKSSWPGSGDLSSSYSTVWSAITSHYTVSGGLKLATYSEVNGNDTWKTVLAGVASSAGTNAWLGTNGNYDGSYCYCVASGGTISNGSYSNSYAVAPAFTLVTSGTYTASTGINITQSVTEVPANTEVDLTTLFSAVTYSNGTNDNKSAAYTISVDDTYGTISGTTWTTSNISRNTVATLTVTDTTLNLSKKVNVTIYPTVTDWQERDALTDELGFHTYTDENTGIEWKFRYDDEGNIIYLYTTSDVAKIISNGVLMIPSNIEGVPVIGIGGGSKDSETIPFIPSTDNDGTVNDSWTSIYIPSSVKYINDGAFMNNTASANITIPGNVKTIGVNAFNGSAIKSVTFNDCSSLTLMAESFKDAASLTSVIIRGNGLTIGARAFANTGITQIDIPNGTKFNGTDGENGSEAFLNTQSLAIAQIDVTTVPSNLFSGNKNLKKVIFGENVQYVSYDWAGTASSNADTLDSTVDRSTYVLNADTVFELKNDNTGSPFGYKGDLTVMGQPSSESIENSTNDYVQDENVSKAKVYYLATNYINKSDTESTGSTVYSIAGKYAKGDATSITITSGDVSSESAITDLQSKTQTGIDAYYSGSILGGKTLDKSKMSIYRLFGNTRKDKYTGDEYSNIFIVRTINANSILATSRAHTNNGVNDIATNPEDIYAELAMYDNVTAIADDVANGTVSVTVIIPKTDDEGNILINGSSHISAYTSMVVIPVIAYTEQDDFLETYGSYTAVITAIENLNNDITTLNNEIEALNTSVSDKDAEITEKNEKIIELSEYKTEAETLRSQYEELRRELNDILGDDTLNAEATPEEIKEALSQAVTDLGTANETLTQVEDSIDTMYSDLLSQLRNLGIDTSKVENSINESSTDAEKMAAISQMISSLGTSYETLNDNYTTLESDYNTILVYIYGDDATDGDGNSLIDSATVEDIKSKIDGNQTAAVNTAVQETINSAEFTGKVAEEVQTDIGNTISSILNGDSVDTSELSEALQNALADVSVMKTNVTAMQSNIEAYKTDLANINDALGLETATAQAQVLTAIKSLRQQVTDLTAENTSLKQRVADLEAAVATSGSTDVATSTDTTTSTSTSTPTTTTVDTSGLTSQISSLSGQVASLTSTNNELSSKLTSLSSTNAALVSQISGLQSQVSSLQDDNAALSSQVASASDSTSGLQNTVDALYSKVSSISDASDSTDTGSSSGGTATIVMEDDTATATTETTTETATTGNSASVVLADNNNLTGTGYDTGTGELPTSAVSKDTTSTDDVKIVKGSTTKETGGLLNSSSDSSESSSGGMSLVAKIAVASVAMLSGVGAVGGGSYAIMHARNAGGLKKKSFDELDDSDMIDEDEADDGGDDDDDDIDIDMQF